MVPSKTVPFKGHRLPLLFSRPRSRDTPSSFQSLSNETPALPLKIPLVLQKLGRSRDPLSLGLTRSAVNYILCHHGQPLP
jgi:hypothetical protein